MPEYRVLTVDNEGHTWGPQFNFTCDDDEQAIDRARQLKRRLAVEVWQAERLVAKIEWCIRHDAEREDA
jgi:hypothetical protein